MKEEKKLETGFSPSHEPDREVEELSTSPVSGATGPRTLKGKEKSKRNALKHGIFSDLVVLKKESQSDFDFLLSELRSDVRPVGMLEEILVEKLSVLIWRYRRLLTAEVGEIRKGTETLSLDDALSFVGNEKLNAMARSVPEAFCLDRLLRYEASLEPGFDRTLNQLERLQRTRLGQPVLPKLEVHHSLS